MPSVNLNSEQGFADRKFDLALQYLTEQKVIPGFIVVRRNTNIDKAGIDRLIVLPGGLVVAAQIKPKYSSRDFRKKMVHHFELHPLIVCIFGIENQQSVQRLARRITSKINKLIRHTHEIGFGTIFSNQPVKPPPP